MTVDALKDCNKKHLSQLAKERGIAGWHAMRKDQLIRALSAARPTSSARGKKERPAPRAPKVAKRPAPALAEAAAGRRNGTGAVAAAGGAAHARPRLSEGSDHRPGPRPVLAARPLGAEPDDVGPGAGGPRPGMAQRQPILRVMDVTSEDTTNAAERQIRDIPIHGGVNNWYIDVLNPPRSYRIDVGYRSRRGTFYVLARSNIVTTPKAGVTDALEENWANVQQQFDRVQNPSTIGASKASNGSVDLNDLFDERLRRPLSSLSMQNLSLGALPGIGRKFHFELDAELIVYGTTEPNAQVTLQGEAVQLRPDGTFTVRFSLPDSRQIIPAVAASADGVEERTIVLAVERNTKELEPMIHDSNEL